MADTKQKDETGSLAEPLQGCKHQHGGDPILESIGDSGRWQIKAFFCLGLFFLNSAIPVLVITFLNVEPQNYWCKKPDDLDVSHNIWMEISGQKLDKCNIFDLDYKALDPR